MHPSAFASGGFRAPSISAPRRLQLVIGLETAATSFDICVDDFESSASLSARCRLVAYSLICYDHECRVRRVSQVAGKTAVAATDEHLANWATVPWTTKVEHFANWATDHWITKVATIDTESKMTSTTSNTRASTRLLSSGSRPSP